MMLWLIGGALFVAICLGWFLYEVGRAPVMEDEE